MPFTAEIVWGAAVAAHRINKGYVKDTEWNFDGDANGADGSIKRKANKLLMREWSRNNNWSAVTDEDIERGKEIRQYFNSYMLLAIANKLSEFQTQSYKIAQKEVFQDTDYLPLSICACLPATYEREVASKEFKNRVNESMQLPFREGDRVAGLITVLSCRWQPAFSKWKIVAKMDDSFIDFWYNRSVDAGTLMQIKGKIKVQRSDKTTQLHYVKKV